MHVPTSNLKTYRYGPNVLKLYLAVAFFAALAVLGWFMSRDGEPMGGLVTFGSLVFVLAGSGALVYFSRVRRQIVFTAHSVQIPESQFSSNVFELPFADLMHVERALVNEEDVLLIAHRNGSFKLPVSMLGNVDIAQLQEALMASRMIQPVAAAPAQAQRSASQI
ncbi:hypothetical protein [Pseudomonas sichuanensis]|uniref:hypothetical protein n=1 Tax=Pseudomonas sichuanensis TaxID=2213015 RepID=UPI000DA65F0F|nr:hypothetical protein [Pseudomonas sichuanensis]